jgi:hypothetical protein
MRVEEQMDLTRPMWVVLQALLTQVLVVDQHHQVQVLQTAHQEVQELLLFDIVILQLQQHL